jgi:hypothetical protein
VPLLRDTAGLQAIVPKPVITPVSDRNHLRGQVSLFRERNELMGNAYGAVWDFLVDTWEAGGAPGTKVPVEMRGRSFTGSIGDGDWVEIAGDWRSGETLRPARVRNLTMNSDVIATGGGSPIARGASILAKTILVLVIIAVFVVAASFLGNL